MSAIMHFIVVSGSVPGLGIRFEPCLGSLFVGVWTVVLVAIPVGHGTRDDELESAPGWPDPVELIAITIEAEWMLDAIGVGRRVVPLAAVSGLVAHSVSRPSRCLTFWKRSPDVLDW